MGGNHLSAFLGLNTPQFDALENKGQNKLNKFELHEGLFLDQTLVKNKVSGFSTPYYYNFDSQEYEDFVQLCDVVYNE